MTFQQASIDRYRRPPAQDLNPSRRYTAYPLDIGTPKNDEAPFANGAPIVAVEFAKGCWHPRKPERGEVGRGIPFDGRRASRSFWNNREAQVPYNQLIEDAAYFGIFPYFDLLKIDPVPSAADFSAHPHGGYPPEAWHVGVTPELLKARNAGLMAAVVKMGLLADDYEGSGTATAREQIAAALAAVERIETRARAERKPLPKDCHRYYRDAQLWLPVVASLDVGGPQYR